MAKFLFIVIPGLGHINPTMGVAAELKNRGHIVGYATGIDVQYPIESQGFSFFPAGHPGMKTEMSGTGKKALKYTGLLSQYYFFKLLMEVNQRSIDDLKNILQRFQPDVLAVDSITYAGGEIAEYSGLPWATCSSLPGLIPTKDGPPFTHWGLPPSQNPLVNSIYRTIRFGQTIFFRMFDPEFNAIRSSLGLPKIKNGIINTTFSPYLQLVFTCEGFEYKRRDWPPQAHLIGPSPWGKSIDADTAHAWIDTLPEDRPIVYVTLGTFQVFRSLNFFQTIIDALKDQPYQVILSVGPIADLKEFQDAPAHFRIERFVPHEKILPQVTAVIHHGGQGIAQDCIYYGIPAVVIPVSQDLPEVARRCSEAGVAVRIPYQRLNPQRLRKAVSTVLESRTIHDNTRKLQAVFLKTNAGKTGADLLEQLAREKKPIYCSTHRT